MGIVPREVDEAGRIALTYSVVTGIKRTKQWDERGTFVHNSGHTQFSGLDTTARFDPQGNQVNTRLGEFTGAFSSRVMQLALRFYF